MKQYIAPRIGYIQLEKLMADFLSFCQVSGRINKVSNAKGA